MDLLYPMDPSHIITIRELREKVAAQGGDDDTSITIEADGEPVYIFLGG